MTTQATRNRRATLAVAALTSIIGSGAAKAQGQTATRAQIGGANKPGVSVTTFHNDNARLGWNNHEPALSPAGLRSGAFGRLWHTTLDGIVHGSPLLVSGLSVSGAKRDVVFAATDSNSVYALDSETGSVLWKRQTLSPPLGEPQFSGSWGWAKDSRHGILSTPVIDPATNTLYACTVRAKGLRQLFQVWALDIATGATRPGWPVTLAGRYKGASFVAGEVMQRGALALVNGKVYVPFGGRGDTPPWRGWIMGVDTRHPNAPQSAFCSSPVTDGAGIWSGGGISASASGDLFAITGNGDYDFQSGGDNLGQSVLRLRPSNSLRFTRQAADFYTPANYKHLDEQDEDLGGATANVLPELPGANPAHLLFAGGKDGVAYLLNRDTLGGIGGEVQKTRLYGNLKDVYHEGIRSTSAYFENAEGKRWLFVAGDQPGPDGQNGIVALNLNIVSGKPQMQSVWTLKKGINGPSSPIVSSDGSKNGVVWIVETESGEASALLAFDPLTGDPLYSSETNAAADRLENGQRFTSPIVANGRVFVGANGVYAYGLRDSARPVTKN